jgi:hypothetical protein
MHQIHLVWFMTMSKTMDICYSQWTIAKFGMQRSLSLNQKDFAAAVEIFIYPPSTRPQNSCDCGTAQTLMQVIFVSTSKISMGTCPSLLCTLILPPQTYGIYTFPAYDAIYHDVNNFGREGEARTYSPRALFLQH